MYKVHLYIRYLSFVSTFIVIYNFYLTRSRIHERTISLRFLGKILRDLRNKLSVYNVYIKNQFQTTFVQGGGGGLKTEGLGEW